MPSSLHHRLRKLNHCAAGALRTVQPAAYSEDMTGGRPAPTSPRGDERRPATDAERKALASVTRLRILRLCLYEPLTNKQLAERLGRNPASVLHHVRTLVAQGFLQADPPRRGPRGSTEVPYRATGKSWRLSTEPDGSNSILRAFFDEVAEVPETSVDTARLGLQLSPEHRDELVTRISALFNEFAGRPHDPDGERISLFLAVFPEPR